MALALASCWKMITVLLMITVIPYRETVQIWALEKLLNFTVKKWMPNICVQYHCSALKAICDVTRAKGWLCSFDPGFQFRLVYRNLCGRLARMSCIPLSPWYHGGPPLSLRPWGGDRFLNRKDRQAPKPGTQDKSSFISNGLSSWQALLLGQEFLLEESRTWLIVGEL